MARQNHTVQTSPVYRDGALAANGDETITTFAACHATDFEQCDFTGKEMLLFHNTSEDTQYTFTIESVAEGNLGRVGDLGPVQLEAGEIHRVQIDSLDGFRQTNGKLYFKASNAAVHVAVVRVK